MAFKPGDHVHIASLGTGIVQAVRNRGAYIVAVKGRLFTVDGARLEPAAPRRPRVTPPAADVSRDTWTRAPSGARPRSLDLHGKTVLEALDSLESFLNEALPAGDDELWIIHGRSGGRLRAAVHERLSRISSLRGFHLHPANPGVTVVRP